MSGLHFWGGLRKDLCQWKASLIKRGLPGICDQVSADSANHNTQSCGQCCRFASEQKTQSKRYAEYPLADGLLGQNFVNQQRGGIGHAPCTAARAEAATFTAECDQLLGVALATPDSQKTILEPTTLEEILKLALHKGR